ncbi:putative transcriptional regulator [Alcanivorax xiamenensis]|uniref:Transcriptional regulator n=1 Tax=Alcanivorax xiamenensis TaxID=1177156 RepID=A0ABQ6Y2V0_9GAMM|nr:helix-turn-helix domain-containing protein [Alcanivorax xiamenensis]KAF0802629.1 putative transcriptional regulator [Alcanivorax xiamenensis]
MRWQDLDQEPCSMARTLAVIGDRWTLLILRDCFLGVRRFERFQERLGITRHVLSDRLRKLVEAGVLEKRPYQERPVREEYRLTTMGLELHPAIIHLVQWGDRWLSDDHGAPLQHVHRGHGHRFQAQLTCADCGEVVGPRDVTVVANPALARQLDLPDESRSPDTAWRQGG